MPSYARDSGRRSSCLKHHIDLQDEAVYPDLLLSPQASCACEDCDPRVLSTDGDPALWSPTPRLEVPELLDELECLSWRVRALPVPRPPSLSLSDWYGALETAEDQTTLDIEAILETSQDFLASYERDAPFFNNREPPSQTWAKTYLPASHEQDYPSTVCEPPSRTRTQTCLTGSEDSGYGSGPPSPAINLDCTADLDATPRRYSDPSTRQHLRNFHNAFPEESQLSISSSLDSLLPPLATPRARLAERENRIAMQRYTRSPPPPLLGIPPIAVPVDTQDEPSSATRRTFRRVWSRLTLKDAPADHSESESSARSSAENSPFAASFLDLPDPKIPLARDTRVRSRKSRRNLAEAEPESFLLF